MNRIAFAAVSAVFLFAAAGCTNVPKAGDICESNNTFACTGEKSSVFCSVRLYQDIPCKGANGCSGEEGQAVCDMSANGFGDACPSTREGLFQCGGNQALQCSNGQLVPIWTCAQTCVVSDDGKDASCQ